MSLCKENGIMGQYKFRYHKRQESCSNVNSKRRLEEISIRKWLLWGTVCFMRSGKLQSYVCITNETGIVGYYK